MSGLAFAQESFDQKANLDGIYNRGFRPELYTVDGGAYASNGVYGVGASLTNSYLDEQLSRGTTNIPLIGAAGPPFVVSTEGCDIRQHGTDVDFICSITLDGTTDPVFGTEEIRIRPRQTPVTRFPRYMIPLPLPSKKYDDPMFENVEIQNKSGVQIAPDASAGAGSWLLGARLLKDGNLALTKKNIGIVGTQETALTHNDINAGFVANNVISITVRGSYRSDFSKKGSLG